VRIVRVVSTGTAEKLPFRWIHHVLTDAEGRRAAATFMLEASAAGRFAEADRELIDGFGFPAAEPAGSGPVAAHGEPCSLDAAPGGWDHLGLPLTSDSDLRAGAAGPTVEEERRRPDERRIASSSRPPEPVRVRSREPSKSSTASTSRSASLPSA
jgi:hypothetical protein